VEDAIKKRQRREKEQEMVQFEILSSIIKDAKKG